MRNWLDGWVAGFWAASLLFTGRYDDYARERDAMLAKKAGIWR